MDTARQLIRYSIPGGACMIVGIAMHALYLRWVLGFDESRLPTQSISSGQATVFALAAIPIGFILYQFYFWRYRPIAGGRFAHVKYSIAKSDRGADVLVGLGERQRDRLHLLGIYSDPAVVTRSHRFGLRLDVAKLREARDDYARVFAAAGGWSAGSSKGTIHCPYGWNNCACVELANALRDERWVDYYRKRWDVNWQTASVCLSAAETTGKLVLRSEYTTLSDVYHSLGATRFAVSAGVVVTFAYEARVYRSDTLAVGYVGLCVAAAASIWLVFTVTRSHTWRTLSALLRNSFVLFGHHLILELEGLADAHAVNEATELT